MRIALFQPDIPQNAGAVMRTAAGLGVAMDLIGPLGFVLTDKALRRAGMDYLDALEMNEHESWESFNAGLDGGGRLVLLSTKADTRYWQFTFRADDILLVGRESAGVPDAVAAAAHARVRIPMAPGMRSLNMAQALAMVLGEALRQTATFPGEGN